MSPRWPAAERLAGVRRGLRFLHGSTLEENLELAADIGMDATTSLDEAYAAAIERHGPDAKMSCSRTPATSYRRTRSGWNRPTSASSRSPATSQR